MIKSFKDSTTEDVFSGTRVSGFPEDVYKRARRKLFALDAACRVEDLKTPPGNRFHALSGDRKGTYSISVNNQWRVCFRFSDDNAYDVEICDYH